MSTLALFARKVCSGLVLWIVGANALACTVVYDMGSSGIRATMDGQDKTVESSLDFLAPVWSGKGLYSIRYELANSLGQLSQELNVPPGCKHIAGGFSAWRLAFEKNPTDVLETLKFIRNESSVSAFVVPADREGPYAYVAARAVYGNALQTSHVLDIGGGSFQLSSAQWTAGLPLGQTTNRKWLCQVIGQDNPDECSLVPLASEKLKTARQVLQERMISIDSDPQAPITVTAVSRPIVLGVLPVYNRLVRASESNLIIKSVDLTRAIDTLAKLEPTELNQLIGPQLARNRALLSDMLLLEAIAHRLGLTQIHVATVRLNNLPGLLADKNADEYGQKYSCYLERLAKDGIEALAKKTSTCN